MYYKHKRTGDEYVLVSEVRIKLCGEWVDGYAYTDPIDEEIVFVRMKEDFESSFEAIENDEEDA